VAAGWFDPDSWMRAELVGTVMIEDEAIVNNAVADWQSCPRRRDHIE
jgi:hypothetical protein